MTSNDSQEDHVSAKSLADNSLSLLTGDSTNILSIPSRFGDIFKLVFLV